MNIQRAANAREAYPRKIDTKIYLAPRLAVNFSVGAESLPIVQQAVVEFGA